MQQLYDNEPTRPKAEKDGLYTILVNAAVLSLFAVGIIMEQVPVAGKIALGAIPLTLFWACWIRRNKLEALLKEKEARWKSQADARICEIETRENQV